MEAMERAPDEGTPLGLYLHIPFCRKRCHFCYFRVYTDKDSAAIKSYLDASLAELEIYARKPFIGGRKPRFVYFGGGTPSYLSTKQLRYLTDGMKALLPWDEVEEVTFECEPGTLTDAKLKIIREVGVTRLSLGVENFDDHILEINGRAHRGGEIDRAYNFAREVGFPTNQHRSHRGDARRDGGQLEGVRGQDHRDVARQCDGLSNGGAVQHHHLQTHAGGR